MSLLAVVIVFALPAFGQVTRPSATPANSVPNIEFEKYTLSNGLQVILHVDRKLPIVHVNQWFHVGSKNEPIGRTGFAHLFEHMMFQGSKNADKYLAYIEKAGANLFTGGVNGTTDWDRTNYFATVPSANLELLLWLESDRLATLTQGIDQKKLDNQRDVVKNERRQGLENAPYGRWIKLMFENLYPYRHGYANDVIGSHEDLTAASMDDIKVFFQTYYTPNNLSLVIAGDFDKAEAKRLLDKYFGTVQPGPALDRPARMPVRLDGEKLIEVHDRVPQERTYLTWHTPAFFEPGDGELDLVSTILSDGISARLNKALVYNRQLCSDTASFQMSREMQSNFVIFATARPGVPLAEVEKVVTSEIDRLAKTGPTVAELNRAKVKWEYGYVTGLERIGGFGGKADLLNQYNTYLGDPGKFDADVARHRAVTVETARRTVDRYLNTRDRLLIRFHPETSGRELSTALDRSQQPPLGKDRPFSAPEVRTAKLPNGMDVLVVERHDLPKVAVMLASRAGSVLDPSGKEGLADMVANTAKFGTKTLSAVNIADGMGDLGATIEGSAQYERTRLSFQILKRNLEPGLAIFADVARNPVFPQSELDREKKLRMDAISQEETDPNALASRLAPMLAFGPDHVYGRPPRGLTGSIKGMSRDDLSAFHEKFWKAGGSALIFSGDITLAEAVNLAGKHFGSWSGSAPEMPAIGDAQPPGPGKIFLVDRQDAAQTVIAQVLPGIQRKSNDYYPLRIADAVWGGGFGTRLNLNLREEKGYSYGVFSFPQFLSHSGIWVANGGVQTNKTKESVVEFVQELKNISGDKPITDAELGAGKANRMRGYAQQFESLNAISGQVLDLWAAGLPMTELQREVPEIEKTTLQQVNAAAARYAAPAHASLLLVGDKSKIEDGIRELNLSDIVFLDIEGRPVRK